MGTLSSELGAHAQRLAARPRIYADANVPTGLVDYMRTRLAWDVLFVLEEDDLRRAWVLGSATLQGELDKYGIIRTDMDKPR